MNYMESVMQKVHEGLEKKKMDMVKERLIQMGRSDAVDSLSPNARFPRICSVKQGNWNAFYVDNGTKEGEFVIAFTDCKVSFEGTSATMTFNHTLDKNLFGK